MSEEKIKKGKDVEFIVQMVAIAILFGLLIFAVIPRGNGGRTGEVIGTVSALDILPTGIPSVYGNELKISFDDVSANTPQRADSTIAVLKNIDRSETLTGTNLQRYIHILYEKENGISCEFCCGARSVIRSDGSAACGCAHSGSMRGLAKYLIKYHGDEIGRASCRERV